MCIPFVFQPIAKEITMPKAPPFTKKAAPKGGKVAAPPKGGKPGMKDC